MDSHHHQQLPDKGATPPKLAAPAAADGHQQPSSAATTPAAASPTAVTAGSGGKRKAGSYTTSHPHDTAAAGKELLDKLAFYITQLGGTLGDGWKCNVTMVTVADNGETGTCNAAYIGPNGKRYRTRAEVAKFLGLGVPTGKGARMSGHGTSTATAGVAGSAPGSSGKDHDGAAAGGSPTAAAAGDDDQHAYQGSGISKAEAYAAAVERAAQLKADGTQLPLRFKHGVVVEQLGTVDLRPTFSTPLSIMPIGYRAVYEDAAVGKFVSEIKAPAGAKHPQFVVTLEISQQQLQQPETTSSTGRTSLPGLDLFGTQQQRQPAASSDGASGSSKTFELVQARNADIAWAQLISLQERAILQVEAATSSAATAGGLGLPLANPAAGGGPGDSSQGPHTDEALDPVLAQLLAKAGSLKGFWGKAMYGLSEAEVLQLIEALPNADKTPSYQFVDERGGWDKEREFLAKGRWAKRSAMQVGVKRTPPKQQQQHAAAPASVAGKKRPHPATAAAAAAAATAGSDSLLFGPAANKRYRAMDREDRQVAGAVDKVLDKMIKKVEMWWVNETAREAKKAEKAEARQAANDARKAARSKEAADKDARTPDKQQPPHQRSLPPAAAPLQEDLLLSGASSSIAPAAAAAFSILQGHQAEQLLQIWEFACCFGPLLGLEQVPSLQQLELGVLGLVSHTGTMASSMLSQVDVPGSSSSPSEQPQQQQDRHPAGTPAAAAAVLGVTQQQIDSEAAAGNSWVQLHTAVLSILTEVAFSAVSSATFDTQHMKAAQLKELRAATPQVDVTTWPEAARRYLAAAATATYLAQGEPKSSATGSNAKELDMPGHLKSMEVQDWAQYLCGGLNMPDLISRIALLPQGSSETAAESLLMLDDAAALAAAEQRVQQLAKQQQQQQHDNAEAMDVDGQDPTVAQDQQQQQQQQQDPDQQQLLGRRLLQALVKVWGDKSKNNSGQRMCFYAQELNPKLGRARGLDLHSVAARLEKGLYEATGEPQEALAADIVLACDLWRDAFNTFDMSHEEGFRTADSRLADAVEEQLQQLLQDIKSGSDLAAAAGIRVEGQDPGAQAGDAAGPEGQPGPAAGPEGQAGDRQEPESQATAVVPEGQAAAITGPEGQDEGLQDRQPGSAAEQQQKPEQPAPGAVLEFDNSEKQPQQQQLPAGSGQPTQQQPAQQAATTAMAADAPAIKPATAADGQSTANTEHEQPPADVELLEQQQAAEQPDPHGLKDPKRPFNPLQGCRVCWREDDKARLLLCDGCEDEYHCYCVTPALLDVPEGDWYCPVCNSKGEGSTAATAAVNGQQAGGSSGSSSDWDMAASAELPAVTGSTEPIWDRPGMQYIKELVGTAQKLAAVPYGSWPVSARLSLLVLLCEMLASSHAGRQFIEERMEQKREAKRKMAESKARINKAKKEAAEAAKAAAKAARQKGLDGGTSAVATAGDSAVKEASVDPTTEAAAATAKPAGSKAKGKGPKGKKAAAAAAAAAEAHAAKQTRAHGPAEEPFDEETELRCIAVQQQLIELANVRRLCLGQDRFRNTYWLLGTSQLQYADDPTAAAAEGGNAADAGGDAAAAGNEQQQQQQQHGHKGHGHHGVDRVGTYGIVMVQPADQAAAAATAQTLRAPRHGRSAAAATAASILAAVLPPTVAAAAAPKGDIGPLRLLTDQPDSASSSSSRRLPQQQQMLLPALQQPQQQHSPAAEGEPDDIRPWGVFKTLEGIDALISWLNPQGVREAALKTALRKVRDNMALFAPDVPAAAAQGGASGQQHQLQQLLEGDVKSSRAGSPFPAPSSTAATAAAPAENKHPKLVLKFKLHKQQQPSGNADLLVAAADADRGHAIVSSQQQQQAVVAPADLQQRLLAAAAAADDAAAAAALRPGLERLAASIPDISMHELWGSGKRRELWYAALAAATTPADFAALIATLEVMVLTDSWRVGFQIWAVPAQHPGLVSTWPQVWYRFLGIDSGKRPGLPTKQQRDRAQELAWRSQAKGRTAAAGGQQQQQQQQRPRPRYDYAAVQDEDGWEEDDAAAAAAVAGSGKQRQQQQQSLHGSRSRPAAAAAAAAGYGSGGRLTRGRQQEQLELFAPRSGRAAAAKAAAAITQQSKGVSATVGRKRYDFSDDEDEDEFEYSEYSSGNQDGDGGVGHELHQQEDEDAALAAALAAESGHPRRAAAVAATAAMAAASGHHPQQQQQQRGRHGRLTRGNGKQPARPAKKASKQQPRKGGSSKVTKGRAAQQRGNSTYSEEEDYFELSEDKDDDEVASELEDDMSEGGEVHGEHKVAPPETHKQQQQQQVKAGKKANINIKGSRTPPPAPQAEAAAADGVKGAKQQQQQQQRQQPDEAAGDRAKQQKRSAQETATIDDDKQQQPPAAKKPRTDDGTAQQQQQQQTPTAPAAAEPPPAAEAPQEVTPAVVCSKPAGAEAAADASKTAAAATKPKAVSAKLALKKPQPPKSKTEALQDLLGTGAAPLTTLSGKPAAAAAAKAPTPAAAAAAARSRVDTAAAGSSGTDGGAAAADTGKHGMLSPKKMLLQRHESETLHQQQKPKPGSGGLTGASGAAGSGSFRHLSKTSEARAAAAAGHFGSSKARLAAEQRAKADPKAAAKEKVAWSDEDDD